MWFLNDMVKKKQKFEDVPSRVNVNELEQGILQYWEKEKIFQKSLDINKDNQQFTFYDGPPYATGKPHYGHILQSAIKDTVLRYKTMRGYFVPRRVGWDCHGLPVETLVEKEMGIKSKRDIEDKVGILQFNKRCRDTVFRYIEDFTSTLKRVGRWADYDNAYATLNRDYMETEWWVFNKLWEQGLVYQAFRSTPYCIRCATPLSNFEVTINYRDTRDTAVYIMLPVINEDNLFLLVWTTTPWTLPGNVAVAYNPDPSFEYVVVRNGDRQLLLEKSRAVVLFGEQVEVVRELTAADMAKLAGYEPLYPEVLENMENVDRAKIYKLVESDHVVKDEGTGLVHIAPAFGEEDAEIGKTQGLPTLRTVDTDGKFTADVAKWAGENIFQANEKIVTDLEERHRLLKSEKYQHSYPFCWRCDTPLIYYALDSWFVKINGSGLKERMLSAAEKIDWTPQHIKKGRFWKGIESAPDWAVSRNRYWSVPMPVWQCDQCDQKVCVSSIKQLKELSGASEEQVADIHRPYVDDITWPCSCGGTLKRVEEVLDVWFDAGSMPYAQLHFPFENEQQVKKSFPADFIVEAVEQTRLWFYVMHVLALALTDKQVSEQVGLGEDSPAFLSAIGSGLIFAEDGRKLSKKLKNYPEPEPTIERYGADVLRLYLLSSASLGEPYRFAEKDLRRMQSNTYMTLWNVYSFFVRYANTHGWQPSKESNRSENVLDVWIMARLKELKGEVIGATEKYQVDKAARKFIPFIDDLSNWYVRRSRNRFQRPANAKERDETFGTLYAVLVEVSKLMAPYMPFVSEAMYRNLVEAGESIHLEKIDDVGALDDNEQKLLLEMAQAREAVAAGLALRAKKGIKVRQPLRALLVKGEEMNRDLQEMVCDEINVKEVKFVKELVDSEEAVTSEGGSGIEASLDTEITEDLRSEGLAREVVRHGQVLRREATYALDDRIKLIYVTDDRELEKVLEDNREYILEALQADEVITGKTESDAGNDLEIDEKKLYLGVRK